MYREILFRGKRLDNGKWAYGMPLYGNLSNEVFEIQTRKTLQGKDDTGEDWYANDDEIVEIGPATLSQFTGTVDKDGTTIFEGDTLESSEGKTMDVGWNRFSAAFTVHRESEINCPMLMITPSLYKVVGSIYDK